MGFVVRPVDEHGPANNQIARNKAPGSAIQTIVAIVTHHKVGVVRNLCRLAVDCEVKVGTTARFLSGARRVNSSGKVINVILLVALTWRVLDDLQWRLVVIVLRDDHMLRQGLPVNEDA